MKNSATLIHYYALAYKCFNDFLSLLLHVFCVYRVFLLCLHRRRLPHMWSEYQMHIESYHFQMLFHLYIETIILVP